MSIQFRDLKRQYDVIKDNVDKKISDILVSSRFISGSEVWELEDRLAEYVGVKHCITCANGTDAITIALKAHGVRKGDAVFVPDFTFFSSGECPANIGATPIFVDVSYDTYNISPESLRKAILKVLDEGELRPRAVVAVDLFGQPFDYSTIRSICDEYELLLLEDGAQGFGGIYTSRDGVRHRACSLGDIATTSFFPAKPLGCYGDGGAIFTDDDRIDLLCRSIAVHGKDTENLEDSNAKYNNIRLGFNSRLDTIQAGVLLAKLDVFKDTELEAVNKAAMLYSEILKGVEGVEVPMVAEDMYSSWAQYTIKLPKGYDRAKLQNNLKIGGIPTNIYYVKPMHKQTAFVETRSAVAECPITEEVCERVLCLPIHPYLTDDEVREVCKKVKKYI